MKKSKIEPSIMQLGKKFYRERESFNPLSRARMAIEDNIFKMRRTMEKRAPAVLKITRHDRLWINPGNRTVFDDYLLGHISKMEYKDRRAREILKAGRKYWRPVLALKKKFDAASRKANRVLCEAERSAFKIVRSKTPRSPEELRIVTHAAIFLESYPDNLDAKPKGAHSGEIVPLALFKILKSAEHFAKAA